jgi:hypothetical protein
MARYFETTEDGSPLWELDPLPYNLRRHFFFERMAAKGLRTSFSEVQRYIIESCLTRYDEKEAEILIRDWNVPQTPKQRPKEWIHKWQPGDHYHVLDMKFDTEREARDYLDKNGYDCLGVDVRYVYTRQGD